MHMKKQFKKYLNQRLNPMFFVAACVAILIFTLSANLAIQQIATESDRGAQVISGPFNPR